MAFSSLIKSLVLISCLSQLIQAFPKGNKLIEGTEREEILDSEGKYKLTWDKDFTTQIITFTVEVETLGFIGFGISPNGAMTGADIVIGGVLPNGVTYFKDYHGVGNAEPVLDDSQDWTLISGTEVGTKTTLKFSRLFDTCDTNDLKIGNDTSNLIFSYGLTDTIGYHNANRGSFSVNLLDPAMPPFDPSTGGVWRIAVDTKMPADDTTYWCSIHKTPTLVGKHHAIGFAPYLPNKEALDHTHHVILHECFAPDGVDLPAILDPVMASGGGHCYKPGNMDEAREYCQPYMFVWAIGGRTTVFPDHVGFPINENPTPDYYMFEVHYNNPDKKDIPAFTTGLEVYYTDVLRPNDAGTLTVGHDVAISQLIPPKATSFVTVGHCTSECLSYALPSSINVFNVLLHSHLLGRSLKIRHYRDGVELPWMSYDDKYDFDYQQNRPLQEEVEIRRGDQLTYECVYDSSSRTGVTLGGLASHEEMCQTFIAYYPKQTVRSCGSVFSPYDLLPYLGIESVEGAGGVSDPIVTAPPKHAGKFFSEVANAIDWTPERIGSLQRLLRYTQHRGFCGGINVPPFYASYLQVPQEYSPPDTCAAK